MKQINAYANLNPIRAGVSQRSILGPILYLLYTSDIPTGPGYFIATFADDVETTKAL